LVSLTPPRSISLLLRSTPAALHFAPLDPFYTCNGIPNLPAVRVWVSVFLYNHTPVPQPSWGSELAECNRNYGEIFDVHPPFFLRSPFQTFPAKFDFRCPPLVRAQKSLGLVGGTPDYTLVPGFAVPDVPARTYHYSADGRLFAYALPTV
jgi:hypothetical protein